MAKNNTGTFLAWFIGGAALGGAVAILLAPGTGEDTRRKIAKQAEKGKEGLSSSSQEIIAKGRELYERGRELAEEAADMFEHGRQIAEKKINEVV